VSQGRQRQTETETASITYSFSLVVYVSSWRGRLTGGCARGSLSHTRTHTSTNSRAWLRLGLMVEGCLKASITKWKALRERLLRLER
jgi:hypothetical protein